MAHVRESTLAVLEAAALLERVRALLDKRLMENWLFPLNAKSLRYYGFADIPAGETGLVYVAFPSARPDGVLWLIVDVQVTAPANTTCVLYIDGEVWQDGLLNVTWRMQNATTGGIPLPLPSFNNAWLDCSNAGAVAETPRIDLWVVEVPL